MRFLLKGGYQGVGGRSSTVSNDSVFIFVAKQPRTLTAKFEKISRVDNYKSGIPENFILYQNYPNPFNLKTKIEYAIPYSSCVKIKIYDILGNEVALIINS